MTSTKDSVSSALTAEVTNVQTRCSPTRFKRRAPTCSHAGQVTAIASTAGYSTASSLTNNKPDYTGQCWQTRPFMTNTGRGRYSGIGMSTKQLSARSFQSLGLLVLWIAIPLTLQIRSPKATTIKVSNFLHRACFEEEVTSDAADGSRAAGTTESTLARIRKPLEGSHETVICGSLGDLNIF